MPPIICTVPACSGMDDEIRKAKEDIVKIVAEKERRKRFNKIATFYPDKGPLRRSLYKPQIEFFAAGKKARERALIGANGVGKTEGVGGYELTCHLSGKYPEWWPGRKFTKPINAWAAGDTTQTTKEGIQAKLVGAPGAIGTGMVPGSLIRNIKMKAGNVPDAMESVQVKHIAGGVSNLTFKAFDQKRRSFQATEREVIWLDEECPPPIYDECLMRTRNVNGMIMLTFTPLMGLTEVVLGFMPNGIIPDGGWVTESKFTINATWEDAPHLSKQERK